MKEQILATTADFGVMGAVSGFFSDLFSSATGILICIVLALIIVLVLYVVVKRIKHKINVNQEKRSLKEDLMIWSNLSNLVSGGKKTKKGKEKLTGEFALIKGIFDSATKTIKTKCFRKQNTPWYVVVGEPLSGKSSLLETKSLDYEKIGAKTDSDKDILQFYANQYRVMLDINGKVFFDHWLGGGSAKWTIIAEQIYKYHKNKPLSGIILTIPADALVADDKKLALKKASLIASELANLQNVLKMHIPCRIVVTKCDCILGFREFFSSISSDLKDQPLGFEISDYFNIEEELPQKWSNFVNRIKSGNSSLLGTNTALALTFETKKRLEKTAYIYSFSEQLDALYDNLKIYVTTILQHNNSNIFTVPEGVYFTSCMDQGVVFDRDFANYQGKKVEDAVMVSNKANNMSLFVHDLFLNCFDRLSKKSTFTKTEERRRKLPKMILCSLLVLLSCNYLVGSLLSKQLVKDKLVGDMHYYEDLDEMFALSRIENSPLFDVDSKGVGSVKFNELMLTDYNKISRFNYFSDVYDNVLEKKKLPFIYFPSNYILFDNNVGIDIRRTIRNEVSFDMVLSPLMSAFSKNLLLDKGLFSEKKADALFAYIDLSLIKHKSDSSVDVHHLAQDCVSKIIDYQYPLVNSEVKKYLSELENVNDEYITAAISQVLLNPDYIPSIDKGVVLLGKQLNSLKAYPESSYQTARLILNLGKELKDNIDYINSFDFSYDPNVSHEQYVQQFNNLQTVIKRSIEINSTLNKLNSMFLIEYSLPVDKEHDKQKISISHRELMLQKAYYDYKKIMSADYDVFLKYAQSRGVQASSIIGGYQADNVKKEKINALHNLDNDFMKLKELAINLSKTNLFERVKRSEESIKLQYQIISDLLKFTNVMNENDLELSNSNDYEAKFNAIVNEYKTKKQDLVAFIKANETDAEISVIAKSCETLLEFNEFIAKTKLTNEFLNKYPNEKTQARNVIALNHYVGLLDYEFDYEDFISLELANESLGDFDILSQYNPKAVAMYINPLSYLSKYTKNAGKEMVGNDKYFVQYLRNNDRLKQVQQAMSTYTDSFVNYWSMFADSLKPNVDDYFTFHEFSKQSRAYQINAQLLDIYNYSFDILSLIHSDNMTKKTKETLQDALKRLELRRKSLTVGFNDACAKVLNSWALLPDDAVKANHYISSLNKNAVRKDYTIAKTSMESKGNIPWWSAYTDLGSTLLKSEASYKTAYGLEQFQNRLYYFPILRDAKEGQMVLKTRDFPKLLKKMNSYALVDSKAKNESDELKLAADETTDYLREPLLENVMAGNTGLLDWAESVTNIMGYFADDKSPLIAKISIPTIDTQLSLIKGNGITIPSIFGKLRYIDVVNGDNTSRFLSTVSGKEELVVYEDLATRPTLAFKFYRYSDDTNPQAEFSITDGYAPVRLYLNENGIYDAKTKSVYIPIEIVDLNKNKSVFFVRVSFNKEVIAPEKWPTSVNWPSINEF